MFSYPPSFILLAFSAVAAATNVGQATFFSPGEGACGHFNTDEDLIVAVSSQIFSSFHADAKVKAQSVCNKKLTAKHGDNSVTVTIVDECPGCTRFDLDLSPAAFKKLANLGVGRLHGVTWTID